MFINECVGGFFFCGCLRVDFALERQWGSLLEGDFMIFIVCWREMSQHFLIEYLGMTVVMGWCQDQPLHEPEVA